MRIEDAVLDGMQSFKNIIQNKNPNQTKPQIWDLSQCLLTKGLN
jgi:hypothetical protein